MFEILQRKRNKKVAQRGIGGGDTGKSKTLLGKCLWKGRGKRWGEKQGENTSPAGEVKRNDAGGSSTREGLKKEKGAGAATKLEPESLKKCPAKVSRCIKRLAMIRDDKSV